MMVGWCGSAPADSGFCSSRCQSGETGRQPMFKAGLISISSPEFSSP
jgi:hypothetical protein